MEPPLNHIRIVDLIAVYRRVKHEPALLIGALISAAMVYKSGMSLEDFAPLAAGAVTRYFVSPTA